MPSTNFGPVQPLGVRRMIIGQRGRVRNPFARASCWIDWISASTVSRVAVIVRCNRFGIMAFDEIGFVAVACEEARQFVLADAGEYGGVRNLVAVEVQNRQHGAVTHRVEEFVGMPTGRQWARFRFPVAHHARHNQVGVVKCRAIGMRHSVSQFPALVN